MSYWFGYRVFAQGIDLKPGAEIIEGPFDSYDTAKSLKMTFLGSDLQKTSILPAESREEAMNKLESETWMV